LILADVLQQSDLLVLRQPFGLDGGIRNKEEGQGAHDGSNQTQNEEHNAPSLQRRMVNMLERERDNTTQDLCNT
jgi:hypothetical protein